MACLEADTVQELMAGTLGSAARSTVDAHVDTCADCRSLLAALAIQGPLEDSGTVGLAETLPDQRDPIVDDRLVPLPAGTAMGRYVLGRTLGAGGMGVVYEAEDRELGRRVAIKLLRPSVAHGHGQVRLRREAQAMARLSHPNVVAVHDVGEHDGLVFVAMELVDGQDLRVWMAEKRRTVDEIVTVLAGAGRGLAAAHAAGIVHRDFKPDNVLVGRDGRARVTDFGLARASVELDEATPDDNAPIVDAPLTRSGAIVGTPAYMAPEQLEGGTADARSDQFAFCVTLYEALYGERPFGGRRIAALRDEIRGGKLRSAPARSQIPASLRAVVTRGLAARPGDRHLSMEHVLAALGRDRTRMPRVVAMFAASLALAVIVALAADTVARDRSMTTARDSFRAAGTQLDRAMGLRYEAFVAMSDLSFVAPIMRDVAGNRDEADFGLGSATDDESTLAHLHESLASSDWVTWVKKASRSTIAVADYKGRLLYTTAAPTRWGSDVRVLPALADATRIETAAAVRGDAPELRASGLYGDGPAPRIVVLFARTHALGGEARALFLQLVDADQLLADVSLGDATLLGLKTADGATAGAIPSPVLARAGTHRDSTDEIRVDGVTWLVQHRELTWLSGRGAIAEIVLARRFDPGLGGLFPRARAVLGALAFVLIAVTALSLVVWRRGLRLRAS